MKYSSTNEIIKAILAGKKLTCSVWRSDIYIQLSNNKIIDNIGNEYEIVSGHEYEDWNDPFGWNAYKAGDTFSYHFYDGTHRNYQIIYINAEVCFCNKISHPEDYCHFFNKPKTILNMSKL